MDNMPRWGGGGCHSLPETPGAGTPAPTPPAGQGPLFSRPQLSPGSSPAAAVGVPGWCSRPSPTLHPKETRADGGGL